MAKNTEVKKEVNAAAGAVAPERKAAADSAEQQKYALEKLRENSMKLFGVTTSTFDGAFCGSQRSEMTIGEAKAMLDKWLGEGVVG